MRIAIFTDTYKPHRDGVVTHIEDITKFFTGKGHEITLFTPGKNKFQVKQISKNLEVVELHSIPFYVYKDYRIPIAGIQKIKKIFKNKKFDLIHIHSPFTSGITGLYISKKFSIPIVGTYHTLLPEYAPYLLNGKLKNVLKKLGQHPSKKYTKFIYSKLDCTIAPSKEIKKYLESCGLKNVVWIPNGINPDKFKNSKKIDLAKKYNLPEDKKLLLFVGRMGFEKKVDVLLKSMKYLEDEKVFLILSGSGPYLKKYKEIARKLKLKNVRFLGYVKDEILPLLYFNSDIFVSPSDSEVHPITFLEAMCAGLPLIGVNKRGAKEMITHNVNGFLAKPGDSRDLAVKIKKLINDEKLIKKFSKNSKKIIKNYYIEKTSKKLIELYKRLYKK